MNSNSYDVKRRDVDLLKFQLVSNLEFGEIALLQGNYKMAEKVYEEALTILLELKGKLNGEDFKKLKNIVVNGLEHTYTSTLIDKSGVESYFKFEKLLRDKNNPLVREYDEKNRKLDGWVKILDNISPNYSEFIS